MNANILNPLTVHSAVEDIGDAALEITPYLNNGGCGVFARELAIMLESLGITDYKIRAYSWDANVDISRVEAIMRDNKCNIGHWSEWNARGVGLEHIVVEWNGMIWDSTGGQPIDMAMTWNDLWGLQQGSISLDALKRLCRRPANWNCTFPRETIPEIRKVFRRNTRLVKKGLVLEEAA